MGHQNLDGLDGIPLVADGFGNCRVILSETCFFFHPNLSEKVRKPSKVGIERLIERWTSLK
jgi:hypothetical protein